MISQQLVKELRIIIKEEYSRDLSIQEASKLANNLVGYFDLLAKINYRENKKGKLN